MTGSECKIVLKSVVGRIRSQGSVDKERRKKPLKPGGWLTPLPSSSLQWGEIEQLTTLSAYKGPSSLLLTSLQGCPRSPHAPEQQAGVNPTVAALYESTG